MTNKDAFATYCAELLSGLGPVRVKRMFGGHGIYVDDLFVAIVSGETLYLKADAQTAARFDAEGCAPFTYAKKGAPARVASLNYRQAPAAAMDSPIAMRPWAQLAMDAALRARSS